jgi:membrane protein YdbS with pleckstrin-like domain
MADWLFWPAELLLAAGAAVASLFASKDTTNFAVIQMMVATLVLAAIVSLIVLLQSLVRYWLSRKEPIG